MKRKCTKCLSNSFEVYPNKLCQKCFSLRIENNLIDRGNIPALTSDYLIQNYLIENNSISHIAKINSLKPSQVKKIIEEYRIPIVSRVKILSNKINENTFKKLNNESAYLLGYIFTDGNLVHDKNDNKFLQIYSKHKYLLENAKEILESEAKIQHRKEKKYGNKIQGEIFWIHIGNAKIVNSLIKLGMIVDKNQNIKFPDIPKKYYSHFIRGCWTGSGCISEYKNTLLSQITIGSIDLIKSIEEHLNQIGLSKRKIYTNKQSKKPSYVIRYATNESEKLYKYLYKNKTEITTCKRQEKLYTKYFSKV